MNALAEVTHPEPVDFMAIGARLCQALEGIGSPEARAAIVDIVTAGELMARAFERAVAEIEAATPPTAH